MAGQEEDILELVQIEFRDLLEASGASKKPPAASLHQKNVIMEALGPHGPGLLSVTGIRDLEDLRRSLLPLARKLAFMDDATRRAVLKDHALGTDVSLKKLDRNVSAFVTQLNFPKKNHGLIEGNGEFDFEETLQTDAGKNTQDDTRNLEELHNKSLEGLGSSFRRLGVLMVNVGLLLAKICDHTIKGLDLEGTILESSTAKGRLIHYHSDKERISLEKSSLIKKKGRHYKGKSKTNISENSTLDTDCKKFTKTCTENLWQQWHYDYGIFTLITAPLFMSSHELPSDVDNKASFTMTETPEECPFPCEHTYLKIFHKFHNKLMFVRVPANGLIVQVGEAAEILSTGKLQAAAHCVCKPTDRPDLSRETFVVFLQPAWTKHLVSSSSFQANNSAKCDKLDWEGWWMSEHKMEKLNLESNYFGSSQSSKEDTCLCKTSSIYMGNGEIPIKEAGRASELMQEIEMIVPSLRSRWTEGQTFAEFSRTTTSQYYGANGVQSNRIV